MQRKVAAEILTRSWNCNWEGVESNFKTEPVDDTTKVLRESAQPVQCGSRPGGLEKVMAAIEMDDSDSDRPLKRIRTGDQNHTDANDNSIGVSKALGKRSDHIEGNSDDQLASSGTTPSGDSPRVDNAEWWQDPNAGVNGNFLFEDQLMSWTTEPQFVG